MIGGTLCYRCQEAICDRFPIGRVVAGEGHTREAVVDFLEVVAKALDVCLDVPTHECSYEIVDPMGGLHRCGCVHKHSA